MYILTTTCSIAQQYVTALREGIQMLLDTVSQPEMKLEKETERVLVSKCANE